MPRPRRIEYENAFYHVMNRGRGRQTIFRDRRFFLAFLDTLEEVHHRFQCVIHAYCLMDNHYHLLLETPNGNLGRIMRHINGVYTQRHNRLQKTDGVLFRGRYKAILVDKDAYLLQLTRYIHRNPLDMKQPMVKRLQDYPWSSYAAYIDKSKSPVWLHRGMTYKLLGHKQRYSGYKKYVLSGVDEDTAKFYQRGNVAAIVGDKDFKAWVFDDLLPELDAAEKGRIIVSGISIETVVCSIADRYNMSTDKLRTVIKGPHKRNDARKIAMYLCQELAAAKLKDIADYFNLSHIGSVSFITHQIRKRKKDDQDFAWQLEGLIKSIIIKAT